MAKQVREKQMASAAEKDMIMQRAGRIGGCEYGDATERADCSTSTETTPCGSESGCDCGRGDVVNQPKLSGHRRGRRRGRPNQILTRPLMVKTSGSDLDEH